MLQKGFYHIDDWKKCNESLLLENEDFCSTLNIEGITDADYAHTKGVCNDFEIKHLREYHDLYVYILSWCIWKLLKYVSENKWTWSRIFLAAPCLAWQAALKKTKAKLDLLTDVDVLLMVEKGIRGGICHSIYWYAKANNKYMKDYDKIKESLYLQDWYVNNLRGWEMLQKLPVNNLEWTKDTSQFNEGLIKTIMKKVVEDIFSSWSSKSCKIIWLSQWFTLFAWKNEDWRRGKDYS